MGLILHAGGLSERRPRGTGLRGVWVRMPEWRHE